jgi:hypothetical protein
VVCQGMSGEAAQEARKLVTYVGVGAYVIQREGLIGFNRYLIGFDRGLLGICAIKREGLIGLNRV